MTTTDWPITGGGRAGHETHFTSPEHARTMAQTEEAANMAQDPVKTLEEIRALLNAQDEAGRKLILDWIIAENAARCPRAGARRSR